MSFDEAMNTIRMVCAEFRGNLKDHQTIQQALGVIEVQCMETVEAEAKQE